MKPCKGTGRFQWNKGGWFGAQVGSTLYLICLGCALMFRALLPGIIVLLCGIVPNIVGLLLWWNRDRLAPYRAIQRLLLTVFIFTLIACGTGIFCEHKTDIDHVFTGATRSSWIVVVMPVLMLLFRLLERAAVTRRNAPPAATSRDTAP